MHYPDLQGFIRLSNKYNTIPVFREIITDLETVVSAFMKLAGNASYSYLLESVEGGERWGRYSFFSWSPDRLFISKGETWAIKRNDGSVLERGSCKDPLQKLRDVMSGYRPAEVEGLPRFWGGAVGYAGYEMARNFESIRAQDSRKTKEHGVTDLNDCIFMFTDVLVIFDHFTHKTKVVACVKTENRRGRKYLGAAYKQACKKIEGVLSKLHSGSHSGSSHYIPGRTGAGRVYPVISNISKDRFINIVRETKKYIRAGDIIQAVMSQRFSKKTLRQPLDIYRALRTINPSPYMYYLNLNGFHLIGSSPEILVRKEHRTAETRPIAGTRPRGRSEEEDRKFRAELLSSPKEKAEHIMLVDLGRNDLGRVCDYSSIRLPEFMAVEKYSHVMHMVSSVTGKLKPGRDAFDLFRACFPAGTVTGAPKIRAMEIISELEPSARGPYAGAVGYFSYSGNMDMAITIRTIVFANGTAYIQAGAGIVADSSPAREYVETKNKARALITAIGLAERGLQ
ncbi:MAG: anthranilate synthase component I [Elusimicrobiota bacterium]